MPSTSENILLFVSGAGILQAIFLSTLIYFHPKSERSITRFLALYIFCISIYMLLPLGQFFFPWQTSIFVVPFALLQGPLLYFYVRSFKEVITWKKALPHFLPFIIYNFYIGWLSIILGSNYPPTRSMPGEILHNPVTTIAISLRYLQMLTYFLLSYRALNLYRRSIQHLFSETSRIDLSWIKLLLNGYIILVVASIGLYSVALRHSEYLSLLILINTALVTPYMYMAAYKGIYQPAPWHIQQGVSKEKVEEQMQTAQEIELPKNKQEKRITQKIRMGDHKIDEIVSKITSAIEKDKLYQDPELTLQNLAEKIQLPPYQVSLAINEGMKKKFYDLINSYRVEEAKRLLLDLKNKDYTILSVGFEAGFNSKTTFNTVFKKFTGMTPTEYRSQQKQSTILS